MVLERCDDAERDVRARAHFEHRAVPCDAGEQGGVRGGGDAVPDAVGAQHIERVHDVLRRTGLTGMHDQSDAELVGRVAQQREVLRGDRALDAGQSERDDGEARGERIARERDGTAGHLWSEVARGCRG